MFELPFSFSASAFLPPSPPPRLSLLSFFFSLSFFSLPLILSLSLSLFYFPWTRFLILLHPEFVYTYVWRDFNVLPTCGPPTRHTNIIAPNALRSDARGASVLSLSLFLSLLKIPRVLIYIASASRSPLPPTLDYRGLPLTLLYRSNVDWKLISWRNRRRSCHFLNN